MNRFPRIVVILLCCLLVAQGKDKHFKRPPKAQFANGKKSIVVRNVLTIKPGTYQTPPKNWGFLCSNVWRIDLTVEKGTDAVDVSTPYAFVRQGDCILWDAVAKSGGPAVLNEIKFIDQRSEGKEASDYPVGSVCSHPGRFCIYYVELADGFYRYQAKLQHEGHEKKSDPELEVSCGTPCGDPGDFAPGAQSR